MTIVCCWLDDSASRRRVTAIADARASIRDQKGNWLPLNENTTKLYKACVTCHRMSDLNMTTGKWSAPYYITEMGIGFAGGCFEAMSIITLYQRCVEQLVVDGDHTPKPDAYLLTQMFAEIATRWFQGHKSAGEQEAAFLLFGFSAVDGAPWAAKVVRHFGQKAELCEFSNPLDSQSVYSIGDVGEIPEFKTKVAALRKRVQKHAEGIRSGKTQEERWEVDIEHAKHSSADKKSVEQFVLEAMSNEFNKTVGGVLQKLEVFPCEENRGVVAFSRDDQLSILDTLPEVGERLCYMPISERMGRTNTASGIRLGQP